MPNLNAKMFYKVKFSVSALKSGEDLLWKIVLHIRDWQAEKCRRRKLSLSVDPRVWTNFKRGGRIKAPDGSVIFSSEFFSADGSSCCWACRITEDIPRKDEQLHFAPRRWITEIGYEQTEPGSALFSCVISYSDRTGFIGPYPEEPGISVPNLVLNIIDDATLKVSCGIDNLDRNPRKLVVGEWPDFFSRIMDTDRQIPYILVSPRLVDKKSKQVTYLVDHQDMAKKLFGNAVVFYYDDPDFGQEMSYCNSPYSCYGGAVRVYQPNAREPYQHRYLSIDDIQEYGGEKVVEFLFRAFAQNCDFYENFFCIEECQRRKEEYVRKGRLSELHKSYQVQLSETAESGLSLALQEEEKRLQVESDLTRLRQELNEERGKNHSLEVQVEQFRAAAEENGGLRQALDARNEVASMPQSVDDVVQYFSRTYADKLVFAPDALKSLKSCTIEPMELWDVLFALANTMCDLYRKGTGDIFKEFREQTGKTAKRGEGTETRKDKVLMRQYEIQLDGETIDIEPHLTYAKQGQSIHFGYSTKKKKIVIGHCGEHLDNYSTRKVK